MNRDDIIRLREQADDWTVQHLQCVGEYHPDFHTVSDERFAALVAAAEREACAKVCEQEVCPCCWAEDAQAAAEHLAERIRARGNK